MLEEYEIQMEDLQIKTVNNISQAIVKFVFRRRIEYHITKTFLQVGMKRFNILLGAYQHIMKDGTTLVY